MAPLGATSIPALHDPVLNASGLWPRLAAARPPVAGALRVAGGGGGSERGVRELGDALGEADPRAES
jgi:hypothetical protein